MGLRSSGDVRSEPQPSIVFTREETKRSNAVGKTRTTTGELKPARAAKWVSMALIFHLPRGRLLKGSAPLA